MWHLSRPSHTIMGCNIPPPPHRHHHHHGTSAYHHRHHSHNHHHLHHHRHLPNLQRVLRDRKCFVVSFQPPRHCPSHTIMGCNIPPPPHRHHHHHGTSAYHHRHHSHNHHHLHHHRHLPNLQRVLRDRKLLTIKLLAGNCCRPLGVRLCLVNPLLGKLWLDTNIR